MRDSPPQIVRVAGLDALRGAAALAVCLFHWEHIGFGTPNSDQVFRLGLLGVELFFAISGFVILMVAERSRSVRGFLLARAARLYPAYLASVLLTAAYVLAVHKYDLPTVLVNLTMLQSFLDVPNITNPYWTLAFEITFYAVLAAVMGRRALARIEFVGLAWLGACLLYRLALPGAMGFDADRPWAQLGFILVAPQFGPFFILGLMVYRLSTGRLGGAGRLALAGAIGLACFGRGDFAEVPGWIYGPFAAGVGLALWGASRLRRPGRLTGGLAFIGTVSYPLYLVHCTLANLAVLLGPALGLGPAAAVMLSAPVSVALAAALHYGLERPVARGMAAALPARPAFC